MYLDASCSSRVVSTKPINKEQSLGSGVFVTFRHGVFIKLLLCILTNESYFGREKSAVCIAVQTVVDECGKHALEL